MSDYETINLEVTDGVAKISLNRERQLNAAPPKMFAEIFSVIDRVPELAVRALLITGKGRAFCSGADLAKEGSDGLRGGTRMRRVLLETYNPCLIALSELSIPVVTAVNGPVAGVGVGLALSGDFVFAAESAYFLQAFVNIGVIPDGGSTWTLPRLVGVPRAKEMMMLGERIPATRAQEWGMIYKCVEDDCLLAEAQTLARRLAEGPTIALGLMRRAINRGLGMAYPEGLNNEAECQYIAGNSEDAEEGIEAFLQKRQPVYRGQ